MLMFGLEMTAVGLVGCKEQDMSQQSSAYQKLPPGEGERRLKETLAKRSGAKVAVQPGSTTSATTDATGQ